jgi:hypothetical protein
MRSSAEWVNSRPLQIHPSARVQWSQWWTRTRTARSPPAWRHRGDWQCLKAEGTHHDGVEGNVNPVTYQVKTSPGENTEGFAKLIQGVLSSSLLAHPLAHPPACLLELTFDVRTHHPILIFRIKVHHCRQVDHVVHTTYTREGIVHTYIQQT